MVLVVQDADLMQCFRKRFEINSWSNSPFLKADSNFFNEKHLKHRKAVLWCYILVFLRFLAIWNFLRIFALVFPAVVIFLRQYLQLSWYFCFDICRCRDISALLFAAVFVFLLRYLQLSHVHIIDRRWGGEFHKRGDAAGEAHWLREAAARGDAGRPRAHCRGGESTLITALCGTRYSYRWVLLLIRGNSSVTENKILRGLIEYSSNIQYRWARSRWFVKFMLMLHY